MTDSIIEIMAQEMRQVDSLASDRPAHDEIHWYTQMTVHARQALKEAGYAIVSTKPSVDRLARIDDIIEAEHDFAMDRAAAVYA